MAEFVFGSIKCMLLAQSEETMQNRARYLFRLMASRLPPESMTPASLEGVLPFATILSHVSSAENFPFDIPDPMSDPEIVGQVWDIFSDYDQPQLWDRLFEAIGYAEDPTDTAWRFDVAGKEYFRSQGEDDLDDLEEDDFGISLTVTIGDIRVVFVRPYRPGKPYKSARLAFYRRIPWILRAALPNPDQAEGEARILFASVCAAIKSQVGTALPLMDSSDAEVLEGWRYWNSPALSDLVKDALLEATYRVWPKS